MEGKQENPNGNYFKIRKRIAIGCSIFALLNFLIVNAILIIMLRYYFHKDIVFWFVVYNLCYVGLCVLYIIIYAILVLFHDIQFEKITKVGIDILREIKK